MRRRVANRTMQGNAEVNISPTCISADKVVVPPSLPVAMPFPGVTSMLDRNRRQADPAPGLQPALAAVANAHSAFANPAAIN